MIALASCALFVALLFGVTGPARTHLDAVRSSRMSLRHIDALRRRVGVAIRRARGKSARRNAAVELITALAAELRSGQAPTTALARASASNPLRLASRSVRIAQLGGDVPAALIAEAAAEDLPTLKLLAAVWRVSEGSGAGLARACDRLAVSASQAQRIRSELTAQLAGPRATAKVLATLPLFGILMGNALGAQPLAWLFTVPVGIPVLIAGVALETMGLVWIGRLTKQVEERI